MSAQQAKCCDPTFWLYIAVIVGLLLFSGLMSGLTLGLMSLGLVDLEVIKKSGKPEDRKHAAKIVPVVKRQHLLLVTLLVGNAMAMEALPLFLDSLVDTWVAIILSVTLLLMFGEILPQAVCSRYGLAVGAAMAPIVKVLLFVMFPIAWPVSKLLDKLLGTSHNGLFGRAELKTLVNMHSNEAGNGGELSRHETKIISGVLELAEKTAGYAMTPISEIFSIDVQAKIDEKVMLNILASGHSRIPVYSGKPSNIKGIILVKNLLTVGIQQQAKMPITEVPIRRIPHVCEDMPLYDVLNQFQKERNHMAAVVKSKKNRVCVSVDVRHSGPIDSLDIEAKAKKNDSPNERSEIDIGSEAKTEISVGHNETLAIETELEPESKKKAGEMHSMGEEEEVVGIITREDVLEELLEDEEIMDVDQEVKVSISQVDTESTKISTDQESLTGYIITTRKSRQPKNSVSSDRASDDGQIVVRDHPQIASTRRSKSTNSRKSSSEQNPRISTRSS